MWMLSLQRKKNVYSGYIDFRGSRGGPFMTLWWPLMLIVGAIYLHIALKTRDPGWIELAEELSEQVYCDGGVCFQTDAKNCRYLEKIIRIFNPEDKVIVWQDVINNTITKHSY